MKSRPLKVLFLATCLPCLGLLPLGGQTPPSPPARLSVKVSNAREFVSALGSHRTIILAPGDYVLSSAYELPKAPGYFWQAVDQGKELILPELEDLVIKGEVGARILGDCPAAYILDLYRCKNLRIEGIDFVRVGTGAGEESEAGGLYLEACEGISLVKTRVLGSNAYALEINGGRNIEVRDSGFSGAYFGSLLVAKSADLSFQGSSFTDTRGTNLVYFEESREVSFSACLFEGNRGESFLGAYADQVKNEGIVLTSCTFRANHYSWFTGAEVIPQVISPIFGADNSFGPDWAEKSVAPPRSDPSLGSGPRDYIIGDTKLGLTYPVGWANLSGEDLGVPEALMSFLSPDGNTMALLFSLPTGLDEAGAKDALVKVLGGFIKGRLSLGADPAAGYYSGGIEASAGAGAVKKLGLRLRLQASGGQWYGLLGLSLVPGDELGPELSSVLESFGPR